MSAAEYIKIKNKLDELKKSSESYELEGKDATARVTHDLQATMTARMTVTIPRDGAGVTKNILDTAISTSTSWYQSSKNYTIIGDTAYTTGNNWNLYVIKNFKNNPAVIKIPGINQSTGTPHTMFNDGKNIYTVAYDSGTFNILRWDEASCNWSLIESSSSIVSSILSYTSIVFFEKELHFIDVNGLHYKWSFEEGWETLTSLSGSKEMALIYKNSLCSMSTSYNESSRVLTVNIKKWDKNTDTWTSETISGDLSGYPLYSIDTFTEGYSIIYSANYPYCSKEGDLYIRSFICFRNSSTTTTGGYDCFIKICPDKPPKLSIYDSVSDSTINALAVHIEDGYAFAFSRYIRRKILIDSDYCSQKIADTFIPMNRIIGGKTESFTRIAETSKYYIIMGSYDWYKLHKETFVLESIARPGYYTLGNLYYVSTIRYAVCQDQLHLFGCSFYKTSSSSICYYDRHYVLLDNGSWSSLSDPPSYTESDQRFIVANDTIYQFVYVSSLSKAYIYEYDAAGNKWVDLALNPTIICTILQTCVAIVDKDAIWFIKPGNSSIGSGWKFDITNKKLSAVDRYFNEPTSIDSNDGNDIYIKDNWDSDTAKCLDSRGYSWRRRVCTPDTGRDHIPYTILEYDGNQLIKNRILVPMGVIGIYGTYVLNNDGLLVVSTNGVFLFRSNYEIISRVSQEYSPICDLYFNKLIYYIERFDMYRMNAAFGKTDRIFLPFSFSFGSAIVFNDKIHLFARNMHYTYDGKNFDKLEDLPFKSHNSRLVVCRNKLHIIGKYPNELYHYEYDGNTFKRLENIPFNLMDAQVLEFKDGIHIFKNIIHMIWTPENGYVRLSDCPVCVDDNSLVDSDDEQISIYGGSSDMYTWDGESEWNYQYIHSDYKAITRKYDIIPSTSSSSDSAVTLTCYKPAYTETLTLKEDITND